MKVFAIPDPAGDVLHLQARMEGAGVLGDWHEELRPGNSIFGLSYEGWLDKKLVAVRVGPKNGATHRATILSGALSRACPL